MIHDTQTCNCEMCRWADEQERRHKEANPFEYVTEAPRTKRFIYGETWNAYIKLEMAERNGE